MSRPGIEDRLLLNSMLDRGTGCWVWLGKRNRLGYGFVTVRIKGRRSPVNRRAHRLSYEAFKGKQITEGMEIHHKCFNPSCVNPDHLEEVTPEDNLKMRRAK